MAGDGEPATSPEAFAVATSVGAGVFGALQPEINAELGVRLDSTLLAALVNFGVALAAALVVVARRPATRRHLASIRTWPVPRWTLLAGLGGAIVVLSGVVTIERLGVAVFTVAFFAGQMTTGLLVDALGLAPGEPRPITRIRVAAVAVALGAVVLSQLGQPVGDVAPALVAFVVGAGGGSALQAACNARITAALGDAMAATAVNVVVGASCLLALVGVGALSGVIDAPAWPSELWLYAGGLLGITIVLALAAATAAIGVLRTTLAMLAAQLVGAFVVDWVARDDAPTLGVLVGAALTVVAVLLVDRERAGSTSATAGSTSSPSPDRRDPRGRRPGARRRRPGRSSATDATGVVVWESVKLDGSPHRSVEAVDLGSTRDGRWLFVAEGTPVARPGGRGYDHPCDAIVLIPDAGLWIATWLEGWDPSLYVDVARPTEVGERRILTVDLDVDVVRRRGGDVEVHDLEELDQHRQQLVYPPDLVLDVTHTAEELAKAIRSQEAPFGLIPDAPEWTSGQRRAAANASRLPVHQRRRRS